MLVMAVKDGRGAPAACRDFFQGGRKTPDNY